MREHKANSATEEVRDDDDRCRWRKRYGGRQSNERAAVLAFPFKLSAARCDSSTPWFFQRRFLFPPRV